MPGIAKRRVAEMKWQSNNYQYFGRTTLALETYANELGRRSGIQVEVSGFDLGSGLPTLLDYRNQRLEARRVRH